MFRGDSLSAEFVDNFEPIIVASRGGEIKRRKEFLSLLFSFFSRHINNFSVIQSSDKILRGRNPLKASALDKGGRQGLDKRRVKKKSSVSFKKIPNEVL